MPADAGQDAEDAERFPRLRIGSAYPSSEGKIIRIISYGQIGDLIRCRFRRTEDNRLATADLRARIFSFALLLTLTDEYAVRILVLIRLAKLRNAYRNVLFAVIGDEDFVSGNIAYAKRYID